MIIYLEEFVFALLVFMAFGPDMAMFLTVMLLLIISLFADFRMTDSGRKSEKDSLSQLTEALALIKAGGNPQAVFSSGVTGNTDGIMTPFDGYFEVDAFERQILLLRERIRMRDRVNSRLASIRLKMAIMRVLPMLILVVSNGFIRISEGIPGLVKSVLVVLFYIVSRYSKRMASDL